VEHWALSSKSNGSCRQKKNGLHTSTEDPSSHLLTKVHLLQRTCYSSITSRSHFFELINTKRYCSEKMTNHNGSKRACNDCSLIIALNNEAAISLASGDMELAISTFCRALHTSKTCLGERDDHKWQDEERIKRNGGCYYLQNDSNENEERNYPHAASHEEDCHSLSTSLPSFDISHLMEADCFGLDAKEESTDQILSTNHSRKKVKLSTSDSLTTAYASTDNENDFDNDSDGNDLFSRDFIYRKPIHVPESLAHHVGLQRPDVILPSIVIFNLAVSHHLWALKIEGAALQQMDSSARQNQITLLLKKAANLYGLAIQLQEGQMISEGSQSYSKLFFLSCINNLGNTHRMLGDISSSEKIYQQLLTMLMYLNYSEQQQGYELSTRASNGLLSSPSSRIPTQTSTYSAGRTYGSFFRNIFQTEVNAAPAA
jgi:tetratricopeptide (TPR) repeat protein